MSDLYPIGRLLDALDKAPPFALLPVVNAHLKETVDAQGATLWLADYGERVLERLAEGRPAASGDSLSVDGSPVGRTFRRQSVMVSPDGDAHRVLLPVTVRADRLGVFDVVLPTPPTPDVLERLGHVATTIAYVVAASRPYTDVFERVRRFKRMELAAEIQWGLLPALAYEGDEVSLAGMLEPAYEFGGDNFDYAIDDATVSVSITDAMGHGLGAAIIGNLAVNAFRNVRRAGAGLVEQATSAAAALSTQFHGDQFVSGVLMRINLANGDVAAVNAGHPTGHRVRDGRVEELVLDPDFPLGMFDDSTYRLQSLTMQPGDRFVLISDGVLEAAPDGGPQFGNERWVEFVADTANLHPTEVVRLAIGAVTGHRGDGLSDDATVLVVDRRP
ncbi:MAG TPA: PP2C family protein-serine/threonine phosphatase [Acidimicrobiales bacterium]|nr:PP2C family protein-serine/threonine phosphatase [Acidimicrobiales bacterium]